MTEVRVTDASDSSQEPDVVDWRDIELVSAVNWNNVDPFDKEIWDRLTGNFWLPEKISLTGDLPSWNTLTADEQRSVSEVFAGLTLLDTIQARVGALSLIPDARTQHEEDIYIQIAHMECMTASHDLLTPSGWKPIADITTDDLVAQYDADGGITFAHPTATSSHEADETYLIESGRGHIRQHVSPGHRVLVERRSGAGDNLTWTPEVIEARELAKTSLAPLRFITAAPSGRAGGALSSLDRFFIAVQADGSFSKELNSKGEFKRSGIKTGTTPVVIGVRKERKLIRLREILADLDFSYKETTDKYGDTNFRIDLPIEYAHNRMKKFSDWFALDSMSSDFATDFISEVALWDGSEVKSLTEDRVQYYSNDRDNIDFVAAIATLAGYRSHPSTHVKRVGSRDFTGYQLTIVRNKSHVSGQTVSVSAHEGERVYGVEVPSTFLVTRNGDAIGITGNCIHAKSYSSIFSTLLSTDEINDIFRWSSENEYLRKKAAIVLNYYRGDDPEKRKIASTLLESFLFYSGFFMPLWWASKGKLVATADIITLILRDESVHGAYIGAKFGQAYREADDARQWELESFANDLFWELYENELHYTEMIYDPMGITEHVKTFLRYNAVKAFQNLGLEEPDFGDENMEVLPQILAALDPGGNANHDFFSSTSSSYVFGSAVGADIGEDDWESMFED